MFPKYWPTEYWPKILSKNIGKTYWPKILAKIIQNLMVAAVKKFLGKNGWGLNLRDHEPGSVWFGLDWDTGDPIENDPSQTPTMDGDGRRRTLPPW